MTTAQQAFARAAVQNRDAITEALALWERRERAREQLLADIDAAEASIAVGKDRVITEQSRKDLACEMKQRGRAQLAGTERPDR